MSTLFVCYLLVSVFFFNHNIFILYQSASLYTILQEEIERFLVKYDKKEKQMSESYQRYEGKSIRMEDFKHMLPKINFHFDPVVNFKLKQKITKLGAVCVGMRCYKCIVAKIVVKRVKDCLLTLV